MCHLKSADSLSLSLTGSNCPGVCVAGWGVPSAADGRVPVQLPSADLGHDHVPGHRLGVRAAAVLLRHPEHDRQQGGAVVALHVVLPLPHSHPGEWHQLPSLGRQCACVTGLKAPTS